MMRRSPETAMSTVRGICLCHGRKGTPHLWLCAPERVRGLLQGDAACQAHNVEERWDGQQHGRERQAVPGKVEGAPHCSDSSSCCSKLG